MKKLIAKALVKIGFFAYRHSFGRLERWADDTLTALLGYDAATDAIERYILQ